MLGGLVDGPREVTTYAVGGPALERTVEARVLKLIEGYFPHQPSGFWRLTNHARKRLNRGERPRWSHGRGGMGVAEYPARIECWSCLADGVIDRGRLGL